MRASAWLVLVAIGSLTAVTTDAHADPPRDDTTTAWSSSRALLQRFGIEDARRLLRGGDALDTNEAEADVLRGVDRAIGLGTEDGELLLVQLLADPRGIARLDSSVLLAATRALSPFARERAVSRVLTDAVLNAPSASTPVRVSSDDGGAVPRARDPERRGRIELARATAAIALARSGDETPMLALLAAARRGGASRMAATHALLAFPPVTLAHPAIETPECLTLLAALGDLRGRDLVLEALHSGDRAVRLAAVRATGPMGDRRGVPLLVVASTDVDASVREAATQALVELGVKDAALPVRKLIEDDATARAGVALAGRVPGEEVALALAARVRATSDLSLRRAAIAALGRHTEPSALTVLAALLADPVLEGDAAEAIARSPADGAWTVVQRTLRAPRSQRLGARMTALRGRVTGTVPREARDELSRLARATDPRDRASGLAARVLLGELSPAEGLSDPDPRVRRAVIGAADPTDEAHVAALEADLRVEKDPLSRLLLSRALAAGRLGLWTTTELRDHVHAGDLVAPLATMVLVRHADEKDRDFVTTALRSPDPLLRALAARGLGASNEGWALGLLAARYDREIDEGVRSEVAAAIAQRTQDQDAPLRAHVLEQAAFFDPAESIRTIALRGRLGLPPPVLPREPDTLWLRVMTEGGTAPESAAPTTALVVRPDGLAIPVAFDDDGYALVPSPPGPARVLLAPSLESYEAPAHGD